MRLFKIHLKSILASYLLKYHLIDFVDIWYFTSEHPNDLEQVMTFSSPTNIHSIIKFLERNDDSVTYIHLGQKLSCNPYL